MSYISALVLQASSSEAIHFSASLILLPTQSLAERLNFHDALEEFDFDHVPPSGSTSVHRISVKKSGGKRSPTVFITLKPNQGRLLIEEEAADKKVPKDKLKEELEKIVHSSVRVTLQ